MIYHLGYLYRLYVKSKTVIPRKNQMDFFVNDFKSEGLFSNNEENELDIHLDMIRVAEILELDIESENARRFLLGDIDLKKFEIGIGLFQAIKEYDVDFLRRVVESGFNVNFQHPKTLAWPIHEIAVSGSNSLFAAFRAARDIDYLVLDRRGYLPSMAARAHTYNRHLVTSLRDLEIQQSHEQSIDLDAITKGQRTKFDLDLL